jgi:hypothetical protein
MHLRIQHQMSIISNQETWTTDLGLIASREVVETVSTMLNVVEKMTNRGIRGGGLLQNLDLARHFPGCR